MMSAARPWSTKPIRMTRSRLMIQTPKASTATRRLLRVGPALALAAILVMGLMGIASLRTPSAAEAARSLPPPASDQATPSAASEVAVLAGGCFWGVQGVFQH